MRLSSAKEYSFFRNSLKPSFTRHLAASQREKPRKRGLCFAADENKDCQWSKLVLFHRTGVCLTQIKTMFVEKSQLYYLQNMCNGQMNLAYFFRY
jgi:hypothetical protein